MPLIEENSRETRLKNSVKKSVLPFEKKIIKKRKLGTEDDDDGVLVGCDGSYDADGAGSGSGGGGGGGGGGGDDVMAMLANLQRCQGFFRRRCSLQFRRTTR